MLRCYRLTVELDDEGDMNLFDHNRGQSIRPELDVAGVPFSVVGVFLQSDALVLLELLRSKLSPTFVARVVFEHFPANLNDLAALFPVAVVCDHFAGKNPVGIHKVKYLTKAVHTCKLGSMYVQLKDRF